MIAINQQIDATQWMTKYYLYLKNYARNHMRSEWEIEEVIQETFYAGLKSKNRFENRSSERTWLTAILKNKIVDYYRRQSSKKGRTERYMVSHEEYKECYFSDTAIAYSEDSVLANVESQELELLIANCIDQLPKKRAEVIRLKIYDELSTEEISHRLNISKSNVWVSMHRARKSIAEALNKFDYAV